MNLQESIEQAKPMLTLFFDVTANNGWNIVAMFTYFVLILGVALAIYEYKESNKCQ